MKITLAFVCAALVNICLSAPSPSPKLDLMSLNMNLVSKMTPDELELLAEGLAAEELIRTKRAGLDLGGSGDILKQVTGKVTSTISKKLGQLGSAVAGASSFIASASSASSPKSDGHGGYPHGPVEVKAKGSDFWTLKKSILGTLFQAIKAITGGVTILKGQLIKGGGAIATAAGGLISKKGEAVTNLGRKIVSSATLVQPAPLVYAHDQGYATAYGPPLQASYSAPSAPSTHYGPPPSVINSGPSGAGYHDSKYTQHLEGPGIGWYSANNFLGQY